MATKQAVNKTQTIRDYLDAHPAATSTETVAALNKQGIKVTLNHVATIKMIDGAEKEAPPEKTADTLTFDQIKMLAQAIRRIRQREAEAETAVPPIVEKRANTLTSKVTMVARATNRIRQREAEAKTAVPPILEKPADTLTLDQIKMVAQAIDRIRSRKAAAKTASRLDNPAATLTFDQIKMVAQAIKVMRSRLH
jgi:hypothetical protein